ncbi:MAG: UDP-N-acetylmuramoyl-L-alanine--D-glutamate ligase [Bdellovibrio sp.]|nr:UDP-N-acetylmuramoyl-L-alanine--D-glutamate ligase [Bdellovibrio sp.]
MSNFLLGKSVAVIGMGVSGKSALKMATTLGAKTYVSDLRDPREYLLDKSIAAYVKPEHCFKQDDPKLISVLGTMDWIVLSPGIPTDIFFLQEAHAKSVPIVNEIELACRLVKGPIIAVTGTNGKTTTVTMIGEMVRAFLPHVFVGGNIGLPLAEAVLQRTEYDLIVLELSSFQLESMLEFHPNVAVILNLTFSHGERYAKIEDYAAAKFLITKNMQSKKDFLIYNQDYAPYVPLVQRSQLSACALSMSRVVEYKKELETVYDLSKFKLVGDHNLFNLFVAQKCLAALNLDNKKAIQQIIDNFPGVPHRVEYVENQSGHLVYNDAKSTNWEATLTALEAMPRDKGPLYLILGGQARGRGDSLSGILEQIKKKVACVYLIGDVASELARELKGHVVYKHTGTLEATWQDLQKSLGGVVLLSPAFPSFDQFKNYAHRGECFKRIVTETNEKR